MTTVVHDTNELQFLLDQANAINEPHLDLSKIFGTEKPLYVSVDNLLTTIAKIDQPQVSLHWDGNKTLSVKNIEDGGVVATFELKF